MFVNEAAIRYPDDRFHGDGRQLHPNRHHLSDQLGRDQGYLGGDYHHRPR
jgi:hypothetical protein